MSTGFPPASLAARSGSWSGELIARGPRCSDCPSLGKGRLWPRRWPAHRSRRAASLNLVVQLENCITAPFGPFGCLEDIYWFNFFGRVYVDFIGKARYWALAGHVRKKPTVV